MDTPKLETTEYKPISITEWLITMIILAIPIANFVMLIVWAVGDSAHPSKKSYAQAALILFGAIFALAIFVGIVAAILVPILTK